jgi:hypothetical protein
VTPADDRGVAEGGFVMNVRAVAYPIIVGALVCCGSPNKAAAQNSAAPIQTAHSNGLAASVVDVVVQSDKITPQIIITNNTSARVYIIDATGDDSEIAFLGSGEHIKHPSPANIQICGYDVSSCGSHDFGTSLDKMSYIEPGDRLPVSITYSASQAFPSNDTISFSLALVARFSRPNADPEDSAGKPRQVRFSFSYIQITRK